MIIDGLAAKALFSIVLTASQGADWLAHQQPLQVETRGDAWLVQGAEFYNQLGDRTTCYAFFRKDDAKVTGINCASRFHWTELEKERWRRELSPSDYARIVLPPSHFEPNGIPELWSVLFKGIIATLAHADLVATERNKTWHVAVRAGATTSSRSRGKMVEPSCMLDHRRRRRKKLNLAAAGLGLDDAGRPRRLAHRSRPLRWRPPGLRKNAAAAKVPSRPHKPGHSELGPARYRQRRSRRVCRRGPAGAEHGRRRHAAAHRGKSGITTYRKVVLYEI